MDELIKRNDLLKEICGWCTNYVADTPICEEKECAYTLCVKSAPAVDAEPVKYGHWVTPTVINGRGFNIPHCSVCNSVPCGVDEHTKYCPNCGTKMK